MTLGNGFDFFFFSSLKPSLTTTAFSEPETASLAVRGQVAVLKYIIFLMQHIRQWFCKASGPDHQVISHISLGDLEQDQLADRDRTVFLGLFSHLISLAVTFSVSLWGLQIPECLSVKRVYAYGGTAVWLGPCALCGTWLGGRLWVSFNEWLWGEKGVQCSPSQVLSEAWCEQLQLFSNWHCPLLLLCISNMFFL